MIRIIKYTQELECQWNRFVNESRNGIFLFNRNYMDYHSDRFIDYSLMFYDDNTNKLVAVLPANIVDNKIYSHQGLTFGGLIYEVKTRLQTVIECFEELVLYMRNNNIVSLIYKKIPYTYIEYPSDEDIYSLFRLNAKLLKTEPSTAIKLDTPFKFSKGRKSQIAKARKLDVQVTTSDDFESFINLENQVLLARHNTVAVHTASELEMLYSKFPNNIKLITSSYKGAIVAGGLLYIYKNLVHTQYLATNDIGREIGGLDILLNSQIDFYKEDKIYFDFGISSENGGLLLNTGLISQKEGFGARTIVHNTFLLEV